MDDIIANLEKLKLYSKPKSKLAKGDSNEFAYNELPNDFYKPLGTKDLSAWGTDDYSLLNTDKWQVPMPRPPVCINNNPCKVCPTDKPMDAYPVNLKSWDDSRKVSNISINKDWANSQLDSGDKLASIPPSVSQGDIDASKAGAGGSRAVVSESGRFRL